MRKLLKIFLKPKIKTNENDYVSEKLFSFLLGFLKILITTENRGVNPNNNHNEYKNKVFVYIFNITILHWQYRDEYNTREISTIDNDIWYCKDYLKINNNTMYN